MLSSSATEGGVLVRHIQDFLRFCFGSWRRALVTITLVVVIALTGVLNPVVHAIVYNVLLPVFYLVLVVAILWGIIRFVITGRIRGGGQ